MATATSGGRDLAAPEEDEDSLLGFDLEDGLGWKEVLLDEDLWKALEDDDQFVDFVRCEGDTVLQLISDEFDKDNVESIPSGDEDSEIDSSSDENEDDDDESDELCNEMENEPANPVETKRLASVVENKSGECQKSNNVVTKPAFKCGVCLLKFAVKLQLIRHLLLKHPQEKTHKDERIYSRCRRCREMFKTTAELLQHLRESHKGTFPCGACLRLFDNKVLLNRHRKFHVGINPFVCEVCDKQCKSSSHMHFHRRVHYTKDQGYRCPKCDRQFSSSGNCQKHVARVHTHEKRHKCRKCSEAFIYARQLKAHQQQAHPSRRYGPNACPLCNVPFKSAAELSEHRKSSHLEQDRPYACDQCSSRFKQHGHLKTHKLTHGTVRPHACDTCEKRFNTGSDLRMHQRRVHKKLRPYKCADCSEAYAVRYMLARHRAKMHDDDE